MFRPTWRYKCLIPYYCLLTLNASMLYRTYFEPSSKKKIPLQERVLKRLESEKDRPRTPTLKEAQAHVLPSLEESFTRFWNVSLNISQ